MRQAFREMAGDEFLASDLRFEICDLNHLHIHVHIAYEIWAFLTASKATAALTALEVKNDLRFGIYGPNHACLICLGLWFLGGEDEFAFTRPVGFAAGKNM